jgi:hypothetical protein
MNAHDIDRGAPPQTHGSGRQPSSTWPWGAANPPRPRPKDRDGPGLARAGGARSGLTRASPPVGRLGPHPPPYARRRGVKAPQPHGSSDRGSPPCGQRPRPRGATSSRPGGAGARDLVVAPPLSGQPCPIFGQGRQILGPV